MAGKLLRSLRRYGRLMALYAKMDLAWLCRDTKFALTCIFTESVSYLAGLSGIFLLAARFDGVGELSAGEVLFMLAYAAMVAGVFQLFFSANNVGHISRRIGRGQLDHMLIQPLPLHTQLMTEGFLPFTGSSALLTGTVLLCVAASRLGLPVSLGWLTRLLGSLAVTTGMCLGYSYLASSLAFWFPVQAEEIATDALGLLDGFATYPLTGMPLALQTLMLTAVPAGLMAWFPAMNLLGRAPLGWPQTYPVLFTIFLGLLAGFCFRKGMMYYVRKGIHRYIRGGFRM